MTEKEILREAIEYLIGIAVLLRKNCFTECATGADINAEQLQTLADTEDTGGKRCPECAGRGEIHTAKRHILSRTEALSDE